MIKSILFTFHGFIERTLIRHKFLCLGILLLGLISHFGYSLFVEQQRISEITQSPKRDDVWILNLKHLAPEEVYQGRYRVAQVVNLNEQLVTLNQSIYSYEKFSDAQRAIRLDHLLIKDFFRKEQLTLKRDKLAHLLNTGSIEVAYRPKDIYVLGGIVKQRHFPHPTNYKGNQISPSNQEGVYFYQQGDYQAARKSFLIAAEAGNSWGQYNLADMLVNGKGGAQDLSAAHHWFFKSAQQGHSKAKAALTQLCEQHYLCGNTNSDAEEIE